MERDGAAELDALRKANELRDRHASVRRKRIIVGLLVAVLALMGLWVSGRMDPFLSHVGLNYHDCVQNAFGATFCGDDAERYQRDVQGVADTSPQDAANAQANVRVAVPSAEAYYADHGNYSGMTAELLRQYDSGVSAGLTVASATAGTYCIEDTVGTETFSFRGPSDGTSGVVPGPC
jgi:hypothetical protein